MLPRHNDLNEVHYIVFQKLATIKLCKKQKLLTQSVLKSWISNVNICSYTLQYNTIESGQILPQFCKYSFRFQKRRINNNSDLKHKNLSFLY